MTFNVRLWASDSDYHEVMAYLAKMGADPRVREVEDFNGQTMYSGIAGLGFSTEAERIQFVLAFNGRIRCEATDDLMSWGFIPF